MISPDIELEYWYRRIKEIDAATIIKIITTRTLITTRESLYWLIYWLTS
jgi:hypothetical protein